MNTRKAWSQSESTNKKNDIFLEIPGGLICSPILRCQEKWAKTSLDSGVFAHGFLVENNGTHYRTLGKGSILILGRDLFPTGNMNTLRKHQGLLSEMLKTGSIQRIWQNSISQTMLYEPSTPNAAFWKGRTSESSQTNPGDINDASMTDLPGFVI